MTGETESLMCKSGILYIPKEPYIVGHSASLPSARSLPDVPCAFFSLAIIPLAIIRAFPVSFQVNHKIHVFQPIKLLTRTNLSMLAESLFQ